MNENMPLVSVIMATYKERMIFIKEAINSILNQTYTNLEVIVINDNGNNKELDDFIYSFCDARIKYFKNEANLGLTKSLNMAIELSKGDYIARMDADDIMEPNRVEKQVAFLTSHSDCFWVGTWANIIDENNQLLRQEKTETDFEQIKIKTLFQVEFIHPTVMFRREVFFKHGFRYNEQFKYAQDYELWTRLVHQFKAANISEYLLKYRRTDNQISQKNELEQTDLFLNAIEKQFQTLRIDFSEKRRHLVRLLVRNSDSKQICKDDLSTLRSIIDDIYTVNLKYNYYNKFKLRTYLRQIYFNCFFNYSGTFIYYALTYYRMEYKVFKCYSVSGSLRLFKRLINNHARTISYND